MTTFNLPYDYSQTDWVIDDPGNGGVIPAHLCGVVPIVTSGSETRTLGAPAKPGQWLVLNMKTDGGDCTITVSSSYKETTDTTIVLSDPGQFVLLQSMYTSTTALGWRAVGADPWEALSTSAITLGVDAVGSSGIVLDNRGSAVQLVDITTGVTIGTAAGVITTQASTLGAESTQSFTVTMANLTTSDMIILAPIYSGTLGTNGVPVVQVSSQSAGSFVISISNVHSTNALNGSFIIKYWVVRLQA